MARKTLFLLLAVACCMKTMAASMGQWKAYMAYSDIQEIEKGDNMMYVLASDNLYTYNTNDNSLKTYDKVNALSDCSISHIAWNQQARKLVIVYKNTNIDLLDQKEEITNIADYYFKSIVGDKQIYSIDMKDIYAYLSTGFGIVKLNTKDCEISDTYNLGFKVDYSYTDNEYIYAASSEAGLYRAKLTDNLLDRKNWNRTGEYTKRTKTIDPDLLATAQTLSPGGPTYNCFGFMMFRNGKLYTANNNSATKLGYIQQYTPSDDKWLNYENDLNEKLGHNFVKVFALDIDPNDDSHVFAAARNGLMEYRNGQFIREYTNDNSPLQTASSVGNNNKNYVIVSSCRFDKDSHLWLTNSSAPSNSLFEITPDGKWVSHHKTSLMAQPDRSLEQMVSMIFDTRGIMWFTNNMYRVPSLIAYQPETDGLAVYKQFVNEDGTTIVAHYVHCAAEDKSGNIWFGTDMGPLMLEAEMIGTDPAETVFNQVKVPRNDGTDYADYLLAGVDINCITIDGGGRKWFGTNGNGAYLISEDNNTQLQHFTTENSKLLSDEILSIAIDDATGEVFFGTADGLCSYMGDATEPSEKMDKDNVYAYPNPVKPGYSGMITIVGLTYNADVKIVTTNGTLVAQGTSNGGTFTWDGNDLDGKRVASGVYMVETATEGGGSGTVCKIAVVN